MELRLPWFHAPFTLSGEFVKIRKLFYQFYIRIVGYEEFHGTGRRFKMKSQEVNFTLDYTPKFIKKPTVMEKVASPNSRARNIRAIHPYTSTTPAPTTEPFLAITILWDLSYIDFPICLDRVEFQYLNIQWDESSFTETFNNPKNRMFFVVNNKKLPCDEEFSFTAKAFGVNGNIIYKQNSSFHICCL